MSFPEPGNWEALKATQFETFETNVHPDGFTVWATGRFGPQMEKTDASLKEIMQYFGMGSAEFTKEWKLMTADDRAQLKAGIGNGSMSY